MSYNITVLPGDGIGPEVTREAVLTLRTIADARKLDVVFTDALIGGAAIDVHGTALPDDTLATCLAADAVLLGAVGGPAWDDPAAAVRPEQGLLGLRKALGLFANLRPVRPFASLLAASPLRPELLTGVDLLVVRELTGGLYFGEQFTEKLPDGERAVDTCVYTTREIERVVRMAGNLARARRGRITSVDKANILETSRLWRRVVVRVMREEFADLQLDHLLVDACAMQLIRSPADFDVIVTENLFGDILTDEAAVLAGSIGVLPSASLGERRNSLGRSAGLYEPIHGSAPTIAGQDIANPIGAILSAALLLRHSLGLDQEADAIEHAVEAALQDGIRTADMARGATGTTPQAGAAIRERLRFPEQPASRGAVVS
jgi:3-isopropylmalate dehydrogenase